jgi:hypothetical protein
MTDDELKIHIDKVVAEAQKAIGEANKALQRADHFFIENNIVPENLVEFVKLHGGPEALRDLDRIVEKSMNEIKSDAQRAIDEAFSENITKSPSKKFRTLI